VIILWSFFYRFFGGYSTKICSYLGVPGLMKRATPALASATIPLYSAPPIGFTACAWGFSSFCGVGLSGLRSCFHLERVP
jgi:hypothetical protein